MIEEIKRDRPYVRYVHVRKEDRDRFVAYIRTIPRNTSITRIRCDVAGDYLYHVKINKRETLYLELAFNVVIKKPRRSIRTVVTPTGTKKTI